MAKASKKVIERLTKSVKKYQKIMATAKARDVNESNTVAIITDVLADVFGYDKYMEITSEFAIRNTYCDLAIKIDDKVQFLIEVKAIGIKLKEAHLKQAIDYGANKGIEWVILTNGIDWQIYRIKFEQPINYDLVCSFDFLEISTRKDRDQDTLFMLSKEGLSKEFRDDYYKRVQSVNRFIISGLMLNDVVLNAIRRELRRMTEGLKVDVVEIGQIVKEEILKRDLVEGEEAKAALSRVNRFYKKQSKSAKKKASKGSGAKEKK